MISFDFLFFSTIDCTLYFVVIVVVVSTSTKILYFDIIRKRKDLLACM